MEKVYKLLSRQAQFYDESWDWKASGLRTPIFGNHAEIYQIPKPANDQTLPMLSVPAASDLSFKSDWAKTNQQRLESAKIYLKENHELANLLHKNLEAVQNQQYNLEVMLSVALLCRQNLTMLLDLQHVDSLLKVLSEIASKNPSVALSLIDKALDQVETIHSERNEVLQSVVKTWYKQWYPQVEEANGRRFLNVVDDVKDHRPARTVDLSYLIYRELHYPLGKWAEDVKSVRNKYAAKNKLPLREKEMMWEKID